MEFSKSLLSIGNTDNLHLCFELDNTSYAINVQNVLEVTTLPLLNKPQKLPQYIVGILNYNDLFINVIDIRKIFNLEQKKYDLNNKVVIIKGEESLFAIIVDEITEFFTPVNSQTQRIMGENYNDIIHNFYKVNENIINIIDIEKLEHTVKNLSIDIGSTDYISLFPDDEESVCIMQRRSKEIAKVPVLSLDVDIYGRNQYIIFTLNEHKYCLYSLFVKELITPKNYPITNIPFTPDFVDGILNLKGNFYTVIDLKTFIGYKNTNKKFQEPKIIVIESNELKFALIVDDIVDIVSIPPEIVVNKNDVNLDNLYISSEALIDGKIYNILNIEKLINDPKLYININS